MNEDESRLDRLGIAERTRRMFGEKSAVNDNRCLMLIVIPSGGRAAGVTPGYYERPEWASRRAQAVEAGLPEGWSVEIGGVQ